MTRTGRRDGDCWREGFAQKGGEARASPEVFPTTAARLTEAFGLALRIGRVDAIAAIGNLHGQLALAFGNKDAARQILGLTRNAAVTMGDQRRVAFLDSLLERAKSQ